MSQKPRAYSKLLEALFYLRRWIPLALLAGVLGGTASAVLLVSLEIATSVREAHPWIIALLPIAGLTVGSLYHAFGRAVERGNNLILDEVHAEVSENVRVIPARMTPLILLGTFLTHLFGGSAGREGTAIQTGASLADQLAKPFRLEGEARRVLLMAGISAGFGSVFGTPLAGAVFGMEVLAIGVMSYEGILPYFVAAFAGDLTTRAWQVHHTVYRVTEVPAVSGLGLAWSALAGVAFGLVAMGFAQTTHALSGWFRRRIAFPPLRPFVGGIMVALAVSLVRTTKYIGLGIPTIQASFTSRLSAFDWALKWAFTTVTLGAGFKGGEVTPLFFIGTTLGNALSRLIPLPSSLLAGMGFVAVFAGAANTPLASTLMAIELFGGEIGAYAAVACMVSYLCSGHTGIYSAQRKTFGKYTVRQSQSVQDELE